MNRRERGLLAAIVYFSLQQRGVIIALSAILVGYGIYVLPQARYDVFPEFAPPQVTIQTEAPGLAPEQVELLLTQPIETVLNGVTGIESLRSRSIQGLSAITVSFTSESDIYRGRQLLAERLATVLTQLPQGVQAPTMTPLTSATSTIMVVGLSSEQRSLMDVRTAADWIVKRRLLTVPGVAGVAVLGGAVKTVEIQVNSERLQAYKLSLDEVVTAARAARSVRGAGVIDNVNQRIVLQAEGPPATLTALGATVITQRNAGVITLRDVADIREAAASPLGAAAVMGKPAVQLLIFGSYGGNTREISAAIDQALNTITSNLAAQGIVLHADIFRPVDFINIATANVQSSLLIGAVLVTLVLLLFLFNLRTAVISLVAIPLSLLAAVLVLDYVGVSLNTMTLGGLAIAIGLLVDDAVIVVENIYRRLRENLLLAHPRQAVHVVGAATLEVRDAVVHATLAIVLVFIPVLVMPGLAGRLFAPLGLAYVVATLASLLVALTVTPALCFVLLGQSVLPEHEPALVRWLKEKYRQLLLKIERQQRWVFALVFVVAVAALATLPFFGGNFLPELNEGHVIVHMSAVPGTSLTESQRLGKQVTATLLRLPVVRAVSQRMGRAENTEEVLGTHYSEFDVKLDIDAVGEAELALRDIRNSLVEFPGVNFAVNTFLTERLEETLSGYTAAVVVNVFGSELAVLDSKAQEIAHVLQKIAGAADVQIQSSPGTPQVAITLQTQALQHWGFDPAQVLESIHTAFQGEVVGQVYEGDRSVNVTVTLAPEQRQRVSDIGALLLRNRAGTYVPLRELAEVSEGAGQYAVLHQGGRRVQAVTCNVTGRDVRSFVAEAKTRLATEIALPDDSYIEFGGTAEAQTHSTRVLLVNAVLAGIALVLFLMVIVNKLRNLILLLINLPFALIGGVIAVFASGGGLSIGALVGFVTVFAISLRNSIMLISHFQHIVVTGGAYWSIDTMLRGAQERLAPVLMTACVTALGLLPLALGTGAPGREIEGPMALVILGGLVTSTLLNLLVLPGIALRFARFDKRY